MRLTEYVIHMKETKLHNIFNWGMLREGLTYEISNKQEDDIKTDAWLVKI